MCIFLFSLRSEEHTEKNINQGELKPLIFLQRDVSFVPNSLKERKKQ